MKVSDLVEDFVKENKQESSSVLWPSIAILILSHWKLFVGIMSDDVSANGVLAHIENELFAGHVVVKIIIASVVYFLLFPIFRHVLNTYQTWLEYKTLKMTFNIHIKRNRMRGILNKYQNRQSVDDLK